MRNGFYADFDTETLDARGSDYRTPFQRDRDRLIHTSAFRRLQAKTQVFLSGEYDFYRTRLTHSIEVGQIGVSIVNYLNSHSDLLGEDFFVDSDLVEAVCLAHDIGHPPYGHAGEATLNALMREHGGFEGNAQTLRIIAETIYSSGRRRTGLSPTRAFLDGVLKYKTLHAQWPPENRRNHFLYDDQARLLDFAFDGATPPADLVPGESLNAFRSLECRIMDWADDTAYSLNDLVDGVHAGFITMARVEGWATERGLAGDDAHCLESVLEAIRTGDIERVFNRKIGAFVAAGTFVEREGFLADRSNRYRFDLAIDPAVRAEQKLYKKLAVDLVFRSPQVCQLEHKGRMMLTGIFNTLHEHYLGERRGELVLLSRDFERELGACADDDARVRLICDYMAGMTDGFATRIYKRLFDPDFGSIVDLV